MDDASKRTARASRGAIQPTDDRRGGGRLQPPSIMQLRSGTVDGASMKTHRIAVMPGDGIGKEVVPEGLRVLEKAAPRFDIRLELAHFDWSSDYYARTGRMMPEDWFETLSPFEAIFYGAVGWPE